MRYNTISVSHSGDVATIRLDRADQMNALNTEMRQELTKALTLAPRDARAVLLTARGPGFCAGQDLGDGRKLRHLDLENTLTEEYAPLVRALADCPVPTVCAVNGPAAGAGASLALAADITIAARSATFRLPFAEIGLIPDAGSTWWLPRRIGMARAMGMALLAEPITAPQAAVWGLIWQFVEDSDLRARAEEIATHLASGPTEAYRMMKQALRESPGNDLETQLELEARLQGEAGRTHDFREGVMAFLQKRAPSFHGQ